MKILHLLYSDGIAGAEKYLIHLLPALKKEGIECHLMIVTNSKNKYKFNSYCKDLSDLGIENRLLISSKIGFINTANKIKKYMDANGFNYLHSHLSNSDLIAFLVKLLFNSSIKTISTKHGYEEKFVEILPNVSDLKDQRKIARKSWFFYFSKIMFQNCDHNFAVSKALALLFYNLGISKTEMQFIQHGIGMPNIKKDSAIENLRISPQQIIIVGRLENFKGHKYLIEAMVEVVKIFPLSKLLVVGNGSQKTYLENLARKLCVIDNIKFLGFCSDPYSYLKNSDIAVLPSLFEPFGLVYIEAFALGIPIVAFDTPAGNEIIENNKTGLLVPPRDVNAMSQKIIYLLNNFQEATTIANSAKTKYDEYYTAERMANDTSIFYSKM